MVHLGEQNNNFGCLLNQQATVICYITELPPSQQL
jgi:hypothetical protein